MKTTAGKPDFSYALGQKIRELIAASTFFQTNFPVGAEEIPWTIQHPVTAMGIFSPRWYEAASMVSMPYCGISPGIWGGQDNAQRGECTTGITLISYGYSDPQETAPDFEYNMACALGALQRVFVDGCSTGVQGTLALDAEFEVRAAIGTDFRWRRETAIDGENHYIRYDVTITFGDVAIYNPNMPPSL
jgi:hypothetical protein